jgi:hypothetical protein
MKPIYIEHVAINLKITNFVHGWTLSILDEKFDNLDAFKS